MTKIDQIDQKMEDEDFEPCELAEEKDEGGFKAPLPDNEDAASDASFDSGKKRLKSRKKT